MHLNFLASNCMFLFHCIFVNKCSWTQTSGVNTTKENIISSAPSKIILLFLSTYNPLLCHWKCFSNNNFIIFTDQNRQTWHTSESFSSSFFNHKVHGKGLAGKGATELGKLKTLLQINLWLIIKNLWISCSIFALQYVPHWSLYLI